MKSSQTTTGHDDRHAGGSILGNAVRRLEDPTILHGGAVYVDDLDPPGTVHLAFVRSTVAHARILSVDTEVAEARPGVIAVHTGDSLALAPVLPFFLVSEAFARPPLARNVVRFVGDIIAVVAAEDRGTAVDAAEDVVIDYDPLPCVVDPEGALEPDAPLLFPDTGSNVAFEVDVGEPADPDLFDDADLIVRGRFVNQRVAPAPMEPNGILVEPTGDGGLRVTVTTQGPFGVRDQLAEVLGIDAHTIHVVAPAVGGGFGAKTGAYPEHVIAAALALRTGRPVKWTETRSENLVSMTHGRGQVQHVELGVRQDGSIVGLRARIVCDAGAYPSFGAFLPLVTKMMGHGVYEIPALEMSAVSVATNTTPTAAYRGAGRPEATALLERIVDMAAHELDIDPVEMRTRNLIGRDRFPLRTSTGAKYDTGDYQRALEQACQMIGYDDRRAEQRARRERGDVLQLGIGVATYVEVTAAGILTDEYGKIVVEDDGTITAFVGTSPHGQGHETSFAMVVAEHFRVPLESVRIVHSDTDLVARGTGTMGSRSLQIGGSALWHASEKVVALGKELAAHLLEASPDDIVVHDAAVGVAGVPAAALSWAELAAAAQDPRRRPPGWTHDGLAADIDFKGEPTFPFGAHVALVEVDTETGAVELLRHVAVDDCGRVINPLIVTGQQHGGIAQGVAQALYEAVTYDTDGNPLTTTFMDYAVPSAAEMPSFETANTQTPTPRNPLGAKGIGESGTIGATPAVQNAVLDALRPYGITHLDMPLTPERIWRALRAHAGA